MYLRATFAMDVSNTSMKAASMTAMVTSQGFTPVRLSFAFMARGIT